MPRPLSHKYPIPISQLCLVNTDVPAGVGAPLNYVALTLARLALFVTLSLASLALFVALSLASLVALSPASLVALSPASLVALSLASLVALSPASLVALSPAPTPSLIVINYCDVLLEICVKDDCINNSGEPNCMVVDT